MSGSTPLTNAELARLLRAFAHMIEAAEPPPVTQRAPRRQRKNRSAEAKVVQLDPVRVKAALRKIGLIP